MSPGMVSVSCVLPDSIVLHCVDQPTRDLQNTSVCTYVNQFFFFAEPSWRLAFYQPDHIVVHWSFIVVHVGLENLITSGDLVLNNSVHYGDMYNWNKYPHLILWKVKIPTLS